MMETLVLKEKSGFRSKTLDWNLGYLGRIPIRVSNGPNNLGDIVSVSAFMSNCTCLAAVKPSPPQNLPIKKWIMMTVFSMQIPSTVVLNTWSA